MIDILVVYLKSGKKIEFGEDGKPFNFCTDDNGYFIIRSGIIDSNSIIIDNVKNPIIAIIKEWEYFVMEKR